MCNPQNEVHPRSEFPGKHIGCAETDRNEVPAMHAAASSAAGGDAGVRGGHFGGRCRRPQRRGEGPQSRGVVMPKGPTAEERRRHRLTHLPYVRWCGRDHRRGVRLVEDGPLCRAWSPATASSTLAKASAGLDQDVATMVFVYATLTWVARAAPQMGPEAYSVRMGCKFLDGLWHAPMVMQTRATPTQATAPQRSPPRCSRAKHTAAFRQRSLR